jgi:LmbE family N-acetylglucosaminyl deacetylase
VTISVDLPRPGRALAIGAHPDDIEFGCGATLAKWSAAGTAVELLVLTDGSKGTWDGSADVAALIAAREAEQRDAAARLGAHEVHFLRSVDGELDSGLANRARVCEVIRRARPEVVLAHDPWKPYRIHPDHRSAGLLAVEGIVAARDPHFFAEQSAAPHRPRHLLLFETDAVDHVESVDGFVDAKVAALLAHRSQWRSTMRIEAGDEHQQRLFVARIANAARTSGLRAGLRAAESFRRIDHL